MRDSEDIEKDLDLVIDIIEQKYNNLTFQERVAIQFQITQIKLLLDIRCQNKEKITLLKRVIRMGNY